MSGKTSLRAMGKKQERQAVERGPARLLTPAAEGQEAEAPGGGRPPTFTRGRHQGQAVGAVPKSYLTFLMDCTGLDSADQEAVRTEYWTRWFGCPTTDAQVRQRIQEEERAMRAAIGRRFPGLIDPS